MVKGMNIDKISNLSSNYESKKVNSTKKEDFFTKRDNLSISEAARQKSEEVKFHSEVQSVSKMVISQVEDPYRLDKIHLIKQKVKRGEYDNITPEMVDKISSNLMNVLLNDK